MRNIAPPQQRYWKERYAEMLENAKKKAYNDSMPKRSMLMVMVAYLADRRWNRLDGFTIACTAVAATDNHWLAAGALLVAGAIVSVALEAVAARPGRAA